jgi:hypothetical protein
VETGGSLLALKGDRADEELTAAVPALRRLGATDWSVEVHGSGLVDPPKSDHPGGGRNTDPPSTTVTLVWCPTAPAA